MAVQERNSELVDILSTDFVRNRLPFALWESGKGGMGEWAFSGVGATAVIILPNDNYDVTGGLTYQAVVVDSGGGVEASIGMLAVNSNDVIYDDGTDVCELRVNADGSVDVRRTAGAATFKVKLAFQWI